MASVMQEIISELGIPVSVVYRATTLPELARIRRELEEKILVFDGVSPAEQLTQTYRGQEAYVLRELYERYLICAPFTDNF